MRSEDLIVVLADGGSADVAGLADAIRSAQGAQHRSMSVWVDDPTLYKAEFESIVSALAGMTALRTVTIIWFLQSVTSARVPALISFAHSCRNRGIDACINLVIPRDADYFAQAAKARAQIDGVLEISRSLRAERINVRWLLQIHRESLFRIEALYCVARDEMLEPVLILPELFDANRNGETLTADERLFAWDFISYRCLDTDREKLSSILREYYRLLIRYLDGQIDFEARSVTTIRFSSDNQWKVSDKSDEFCRMRALAFTASAGTHAPTTRLSKFATMAHDVAEVLLEALNAYWQRVRVRKATVKKISGDERFEKVLLIGAYGGEHIGDAAILGGVLIRLHERFGTSSAVLMTQRKRHTRHLIPMLDVPVDVTVDDYERGPIRQHLKRADAVIFAGGPLVDIPKQLVRHLYTVSIANRMGKPFLAEGIGPGPFTRWPSWFTARRTVELAGQINVRTSDSAGHDVVSGLDLQVGRCPAFDYLASRDAELSRLPASERNAIEHLLAETEGRPVIGVNIRPIGHLHTIGAPDGDLEGYTRHIEDRFEKRMAAGMREFAQRSETKPCFVYFPMNAIQFGSSDILSAYRIRRALGPEVDFRVWQADASLDGVVALLRHVDIAITMRFHATIFALSQGCQVIGIDYRIGKRDKVAELLDDVGQGENCTRIDLLTSQWLAERLAALTSRSAESGKLAG